MCTSVCVCSQGCRRWCSLSCMVMVRATSTQHTPAETCARRIRGLEKYTHTRAQPPERSRDGRVCVCVCVVRGESSNKYEVREASWKKRVSRRQRSRGTSKGEPGLEQKEPRA